MSIQEMHEPETVTLVPAFSKDTGLLAQAASISGSISEALAQLEAFRDKIRGGKRVNVNVTPLRSENGNDGGMPGIFENSARRVCDLKKLIADLDSMF